MPKINQQAIIQALREKTDFDQTKIANLLEEMKMISDALAEEEKAAENGVKYKKKYVAISATNFGDTTPRLDQQALFIVRVPEVMTEEEVLMGISAAAFDFNEKQKRETSKVQNIVQALTYVKPKYFKPYLIQIITKEEIPFTLPIAELETGTMSNFGEFLPRLDIEKFKEEKLQQQSPAAVPAATN